MRTKFIVTIQGNWREGDKRVTAADIERELRDAVKERFEFLTERVTVKRAPPDKTA